MILSRAFRPYRKRILLAFSFVLIEKTAWILEPTLFGNVIDAMIEALASPPLSSPVVPLLAWIGVFGINSGVGTYRRIRDEKIYLAIHNDLAAQIAAKVHKGILDASRAAARAVLSREVISFYQYRMPDFIEQAIDVGGAIIALTLFDWRLGGTCVTILIPLFFINRFYSSRVSQYQRQIHDQQEDVYRIYASHDLGEVRSYYDEMAKWKQKIANAGAVNFGFLRMFLLGIFLIILYVAIDLDNFTTGNIYSIAAYVWTFITSSEYLPEQLESWTSMKEITGRLESEEA
jgi:ABC-type multidrug transport system fused ATPase/permease subunit